MYCAERACLNQWIDTLSTTICKWNMGLHYLIDQDACSFDDIRKLGKGTSFGTVLFQSEPDYIWWHFFLTYFLKF